MTVPVFWVSLLACKYPDPQIHNVFLEKLSDTHSHPPPFQARFDRVERSIVTWQSTISIAAFSTCGLSRTSRYLYKIFFTKTITNLQTCTMQYYLEYVGMNTIKCNSQPHVFLPSEIASFSRCFWILTDVLRLKLTYDRQTIYLDFPIYYLSIDTTFDDISRGLDLIIGH